MRAKIDKKSGIFVPVDFLHLVADVVVACEDKEEVAQPVEVLQHDGVDHGLVSQGDDASLGATGECAAHVAHGAQAAAARQDEALHGRQRGIPLVDVLLQHFHVGRGEAVKRGGVAVIGKISADVEQFVLNAANHGGHVLLAHALAAHQRGGAGITGEGVNLTFHSRMFSVKKMIDILCVMTILVVRPIVARPW